MTTPGSSILTRRSGGERRKKNQEDSFPSYSTQSTPLSSSSSSSSSLQSSSLRSSSGSTSSRHMIPIHTYGSYQGRKLRNFFTDDDEAFEYTHHTHDRQYDVESNCVNSSIKPLANKSPVMSSPVCRCCTRCCDWFGFCSAITGALVLACVLVTIAFVQFSTESEAKSDVEHKPWSKLESKKYELGIVRLTILYLVTIIFLFLTYLRCCFPRCIRRDEVEENLVI